MAIVLDDEEVTTLLKPKLTPENAQLTTKYLIVDRAFSGVRFDDQMVANG